MTHPFTWNGIQHSGCDQPSPEVDSAPPSGATPQPSTGFSDRPAWSVAEGTVLHSVSEVPGYHHLAIYAPAVAVRNQPGQFVMLRTEPWAPLVVGRPFDIYRSDPEARTFEVLFRVKGAGTSKLARLSRGGRLWVVGPLGRPIRLQPGRGVGLVGRGVGVAPLVRIAQEAVRLGIPVRAVLSTRFRPAVGFSDLKRLAVATEEVVEEGVRTVRETIEGWIQSGAVAQLYTCGSARLGRLVRDLSVKYGLEAFGFADSFMACGIGVCHGCAVQRHGTACPTGEGGAEPHALACVDGPCFPVVELYGSRRAESGNGSIAHA